MTLKNHLHLFAISSVHRLQVVSSISYLMSCGKTMLRQIMRVFWNAALLAYVCAYDAETLIGFILPGMVAFTLFFWIRLCILITADRELVKR
jgi:hypothetical protein